MLSIANMIGGQIAMVRGVRSTFCWLSVAMSLALVFDTATSQSQKYVASVRNQVVIDDTSYQFDLIVLRSDTTAFRMADATFQLTFNAPAFAPLSIAYLGGSSTLAGGYVISPELNATRINIEVQSPTAYAASTEVPTDATGVRIGTFRVSRIVRDGDFMDLAWRTPLLTYQALLERKSDDSVHDLTPGGSYQHPQNTKLGGSPLLIASRVEYSFGNNQVSMVGTQPTDSLEVVVKDQFGQPFAGKEVRFSFGSVPSGAAGQRLRDTLVVSNSAGLASTRLTLGTKAGIYSVLASADMLAGSPVNFTATAVAGPPVSIFLASGDAQTAPPSTRLSTPLTVLVTDEFANPVSGVSIGFNITSTPPGATGQKLEPLVTTTDSSGRASSQFTLGNVAGIYTIAAAAGTGGLIGGPVQFVATASSGGSGPATALLMSHGNNQIAKVLEELQTPLVVIALNAAGTPVEGVPVRFAIDSIPQGAIGYRLSDTLTTTNASGEAMTFVKLGSKTGQYTIRASSAGLSGSPILFGARAVAGPAAALDYVAGNNQRKPIGSVLDTALTVRVVDSVGNAVTGTRVEFAFVQVPSGATGYSMSTSVVATDSAGIASTRVTLGNKVGTYVVNASSTGLKSSPIVFVLSALDSITTSVVAETVPAEFRLLQNYPNPFNPSTTIEFEVPRTGQAATELSIDIYNQLGEKITTLTVGEFKPGRHKVIWYGVNDSGQRVASGVYYYHLLSREYRSSKKMILVK
ncbi:MAG: hypothetical protein FJ215_13205 [Ignavibacteria bacterium]|nr:hypothetical protein [Ignavibacteria bacterium]